MATVFTPEHSPLDRIFAADTTYRIPAYQRPYSWQAVGKSERDNQVVQMWQDLSSFFEDNRQNNKEYFLGSMVIIEDRDKLRTFEVIDGQQRLTTLLLLFAAMRCFLREVERMPGGFPEGSEGADVARPQHPEAGVLPLQRGGAQHAGGAQAEGRAHAGGQLQPGPREGGRLRG